MDVPDSIRSPHPFKSVLSDVTLALLHVNHQISAEAASTFYGKRTFYSSRRRLIPFLEEVGLHRHLIKDIQLLADLNSQSAWNKQLFWEMQFPPQTINFLQTLEGLRSLTIWTKAGLVHRLQQQLFEAGIHRLTERVVVTVHYEYGMVLEFMEEGKSVTTEESVIFKNTLTCEKGGKEWESSGFHCRVTHRIDEGRPRSPPYGDPSQPCNHGHHRLERIAYDATRIRTPL